MAYPDTLDTLTDDSLGRVKINQPGKAVRSLDWDTPAKEINAWKSAIVELETAVGLPDGNGDAFTRIATLESGTFAPNSIQTFSSSPGNVASTTALVRVTYAAGTATLDFSALAIGQLTRIVKANASAYGIAVKGGASDQVNGGTAAASMTLPGSTTPCSTTSSDPDWWVYRVDGTNLRVYGGPAIPAPSQLSATAASQGLWLFAGSLSDSSGNSRTLGGLSAPPYLYRPGVGIYGQRAIVGGAYTNAAAWDSIATGNKTIEAVVRTRGNGTDQILAFVGKNLGAAADTMWLFYIAANGQLYFDYYSSGPTLRSLGSDAIVPGGQLCHVAATMSVSGPDVTVKLYVNGWLSGTTTFSSAAPVTVASSQLYALDNPAADSPFTDTTNGAEIHGLHITNDVMDAGTIGLRAVAALGVG